MRSRALPLIFALLAAVAPFRAAAQEEEPPRPRASLSVIPKVGGFFMGGDLGSAGEVSSPTLVDAGGKFGSFGAGLELALPREPFNIRLSADYVSGAAMRRDRVLTGGSVDILNVTIDGVMRSYTRTRKTFQSYALAGVGIKRYNFTEGNIAEAEITGSMMDWAAHLGFGLDFAFGRMSVILEASDYVSWFDANDPAISPAGKMQNDLFLQAGVRIPIF
jgi:hypothetical protein